MVSKFGKDCSTKARAWVYGLGFQDLKPGPSPFQALVRALVTNGDRLGFFFPRKDFSERQFAFVPSNFTLSFNDTSILHHLLLPQLMGSRFWKTMTGAFAVPVTA